MKVKLLRAENKRSMEAELNTWANDVNIFSVYVSTDAAGYLATLLYEEVDE